MLLNREIAQWLITDKSLYELCISFDGASKKTVERIRRGANYETILSNIEYLSFQKKKRRRIFPRLWFRYVIMKSNAEELPNIIPICAKYGLSKVVVKYLNVSNDIDFKESLFNHPKLAAQVFQETRRLAKEYGVRVDLPPLIGEDEHAKRCLSPWHFCQIDTDGSIKFCYQSWRQRIGFFSDKFKLLWQGEHYQKIRKTVDSEAPYFPYCRYCSARRGVNRESSHNQKLHAESYVIPGLEELQVPFNLRAEENVSSFKEFHAAKEA
jgi:MoaA/NifB/PqqE/SkfB family radical SAM enzyme